MGPIVNSAPGRRDKMFQFRLLYLGQGLPMWYIAIFHFQNEHHLISLFPLLNIQLPRPAVTEVPGNSADVQEVPGLVCLRRIPQ